MRITKVLKPLGTISLSLVGGFTGAIVAVHPAGAFTVTKVDYLGQSIFPTNTYFGGTQLGGLSGITYDPSKKVYYSISDDRSQVNPARFYTLKIDLSQGSLKQGGVTPVGVTTLLNAQGQPFAPLSLDPEGIALTNNGSVFISSEGDTNRLIDPFVNEFSLATGQQISTLPIPNKFLPTADKTRGVRNNLAFENLTITPDQKYLFTATENALAQDGPAAALGVSSPSRILKYDLTTRQPIAEFLYNTDPVALPPASPTGASNNGLVDLLALDNSGKSLLALERSFSEGAVGTPGNTGDTIKLYEVSLEGATDISKIDSLAQAGTGGITPAQKKLLLDFTTLGIPIDNIEGLTFGPTLADGRRSLVVVADNNFSSTQFTQVLAFGIKTKKSVPEPSAVAGLALLALAGLRAKRRKTN